MELKDMKFKCAPCYGDRIAEVHALESYILGHPSADEVKQFLREACGVDNYDSKVYTNCNGAIAVVCNSLTDGCMRLEQFIDKVLVVPRYKDGSHDILMLSHKDFRTWFKVLPANGQA